MTNNHKTALEAQLDQLLSESVDAAQKRARTEFDRTIEPHGSRMVLFGAGSMGRRVLARLRQDGIDPLAFADNQANNWGKTIDGLPVLRPDEAARCYGRDATFIVTIYNNSHNYLATRHQLLTLGCDNIVSLVPLRWKYHETFLPYFRDDLPHHVLLQADAILAALTLWSDAESQREYVAQIAWRLHGDFDALGPPLCGQQYFPAGLFRLTADEFFVDAGAYDGDTLRQFFAQQGTDFRGALALEPDPDNFRRLTAFRSTLTDSLQNKIEAQPLAIGNRSCILRFAAGDGTSSAVSAGGSVEVACVRLDDLLLDRRPTYIKMDIEGAEPDAIDGCQRVLREDCPVLAACVYHAQHHLWTIPELIHRLAPSYRLFLRPHMFECWETVCYAVPGDRLLSGSH